MIPSVLPTYSRAPLHFVKGEGTWLVEEDGRRFLDLGSGIAVNALGHAHPALVAALTAQAQNLWHVSNLYEIPQQQALADKLVAASFADTVFFTNSGTESCELAVKMARKYWYDKGQPEKTDIIAFAGSFHGRSSAGIAAAGSEKMTKGFGPLLPGFKHLPWDDQDALEAAIDDATAAILIEPVQGEGGIRPIDPDVLRKIRKICDDKGALLILDEVQSGVGRTGRLFAHEWAGITPDIMAVAKGIGAGFPFGVCLSTASAADGMTAGTHGTTYGGNPLAMAVGNAVLDVILEEGFLDHINDVANALSQGLVSLKDRYPDLIEDVRGNGLMLGIKCAKSNMEVVQAFRAENLLSVPAGDNVVRLLPPLTLTAEEAREGLKRMDAALEKLTRG